MEPRPRVPKPVDNLASLFKVRRGLLDPVGSLPLSESGLTFESSDLLISLYRASKCGWRELENDAEGFVTFKSLERLLVNSQPQVSRRVKGLSCRGLVDVKAPRRNNRFHGNTRLVRINANGIGVIEPIWLQYMKLAEHFLEGVSAGDRRAHYEVNKIIRERIRSKLIEPLAERTRLHPVHNLLKVFETTRDLFGALDDYVLVDSDLTQERADTLIVLYLCHCREFGNSGIKVDREGFVISRALLTSLVFSQTLDETLLERRLTDFVAEKLVEPMKDREPIRQKTCVRITSKGIAVAKLIWERYKQFADRVLEDTSLNCREAHYRVNEAIHEKTRPSWEAVVRFPLGRGATPHTG